MFLCGKIKQYGDYFSLRKRVTLKNMSRNFSTEKCISGIHKKLKSVCVCNMISPTRKPPQSSPPSLRICLRVLCLSHSLMGATLLLITLEGSISHTIQTILAQQSSSFNLHSHFLKLRFTNSLHHKRTGLQPPDPNPTFSISPLQFSLATGARAAFLRTNQ